MSVNTTEILIPGQAQAVWDVLTDLASYPRWNPFIRRLEGRLEVGARWQMEVTVEGRVFLPVPIVITQIVPGRQLTWRGGIPRTIVGLHDFNLSEAHGLTRLVQSERFSGLAVPVLFPMLRGSLLRQFVRMNEALRSEVMSRRGVACAAHPNAGA